jgi:hypothetical protein
MFFGLIGTRPGSVENAAINIIERALVLPWETKDSILRRRLVIVGLPLRAAGQNLLGDQS